MRGRGAALAPALHAPAPAASAAPASLAPPTDASAPAAAPEATSALLIGVDRAPGARPLQGAVNDVANLREVLVRGGMPPDRITYLVDARATRDAILAGIEALASTPADARVVFAFAGHTRLHRGVPRIIAGDGRPIAAPDLAAAMARISAPMWAAFPTCYAEAFALPGIVGPGRVVTFASRSNELAWESEGQSFKFRYMVWEGLLHGRARAPTVEAAFEYAVEALTREDKTLVPLMDDQYPGEFELGNGHPAAGATLQGWADEPGPPGHPTPGPGAAPPPPRSSPSPPPTGSDRQEVHACGSLVRVGSCPASR